MSDMTSNANPETQYKAREKRINDALEMKQPDRVPVMASFGYFLADYAGVTRQELHENPEKHLSALKKAALEFQPDLASGIMGGAIPSKILGDQMTRWPGYGLGEHGSFQFVEKEFMKADDYDALLNDPSDFAVRKYLPRVFSSLKGFSDLPPLGMLLYGYYNLRNLARLNATPIIEAVKALREAANTLLTYEEQAVSMAVEMAAIGFPGATFIIGPLIEAPFDFMSDTLRGMRGIFLDMLRQPEKLLAAEEKVKKIMLDHAMAASKASGIGYATFPLHRGSDGIISLAQFEKFYWPQLKDMLLQLIDTGITPCVFYEGCWDERLVYLAELPKGKTIGLFQSSDIFKVKEVLGDTMCIIGGMPVSMLGSSTETEVREYTHRLCEEVGKGGGFIMSTNVMELEGCDAGLIKTWIDATREYGRT